MMRQRLAAFRLPTLPYWLAMLLCGVFIFRIPSLLEPFYYGDEMIYLDLGEGIRRGLTLYKDVHDNKPPLLYFTAAIAGNVFWFRAILAFWMMATIVLFWAFVKKVSHNNKLAAVAAVCFAVFTSLPFFEGHVANAELFMIGPTVGAFWLIAHSKNKIRNSLLAGGLMAIATLFKVPSAFDAGAIVFLWVIHLAFTKKSIFVFVKQLTAFSLGFIVVIGSTFIWYWMKGALTEYMIAAFLQNFGYVSSWREGSMTANVPFLTKNGPLLLRGIAVLIVFFVTWLFRKKRSTLFLLSCLWLATSLFAATLSERPYPHYFIQVLPSLSILFAILFTDETLEQSLTILPLTLAFFVPVYFHFWQYSSSHYIGRFLTLAQEGGGAPYFQEFGTHVNRNYNIARFIRGSVPSSGSVFVWGDGSAIYALSRHLPPIKYVADYHIRDFSSKEETLSMLVRKRPSTIVILPEAEAFQELERFVRSGYIRVADFDGAAVWYNTDQ